MKKLKDKLSFLFSIGSPDYFNDLHALLVAVEVELKTLKAIAENVIEYFYPQDSDTVRRAPEMLDLLPT
jgi:hypothetical protein